MIPSRHPWGGYCNCSQGRGIGLSGNADLIVEGVPSIFNRSSSHLWLMTFLDCSKNL